MKKIHNWTSKEFWKQWTIMASAVLVPLEGLELVLAVIKAYDLTAFPSLAKFVASATFQGVSFAVALALPILRNFKQS